MSTRQQEAIEFDEFEAVCGAIGDLSCLCDAERRTDAVWSICTREHGHAGDHITAVATGKVLGRWNDGTHGPGRTWEL